MIFDRRWFVVPLLLTAVGCDGTRDEAPIPSGWTNYAIGTTGVKVSVPPDYATSTEPEETLVLTPPGNPGVKLRLNAIRWNASGANGGEDFVRSQARKKGLSVVEKYGKVFLTEKAPSNEAGQKAIAQFWQVGFGDRIVVMSANVLDAKKDAPEVVECVQKTVPKIIDSLQK